MPVKMSDGFFGILETELSPYAVLRSLSIAFWYKEIYDQE